MTDKTADDIIDSYFPDFNEKTLAEFKATGGYQVMKSAMNEFASQKTSSQEAENKRLKESILAGQEGLIQRLEDRTEDLQILLDATKRGIEQRDELLKLAESALRDSLGLTNYIPIELENNTTKIVKDIESAINKIQHGRDITRLT